VLISLSPDRDVLNLHRLDVHQELEDSDDYLVVDQPPIIAAQAGQDYKYQISARTKDGPIQFELTSGPDGAQLSPTGEVVWRVPADWSAPSQDLVVTLRNGSGREVLHGWTVIFPALLPKPDQ
jgi:hypothetical protein